MAWKSSFRQKYRNFLAHTVPPFAARISHVVVWEILPNEPFKFFEILASVMIHLYSGTCLIVLVHIHWFVTWALDGNEWSTINLIRFTPGKEQIYPLSRRFDGHQSLSRRFRAELRTCRPKPEKLLSCNSVSRVHGMFNLNMFLKLITIRDDSLPRSDQARC
jgi:hypothetical protein